MNWSDARVKRCERILMKLNENQKPRPDPAQLQRPRHPLPMPKVHPIKWFHDWEDRILVESWIPIRFQPILFVFLFVGAVFLFVKRPTLPTMSAMAGSGPAYTWFVLALACPPLLFIAWLMIHYGTGRKTYLGYWMRFAADAGQAVSFGTWMLVLTSDQTPELEDAYAWIVLTSILVFLIVLVVRDVLKVVLLERTSSAVQGVKDEKILQDIQDEKDERIALKTQIASNRERIKELEHGAETSLARADEAHQRADTAHERADVSEVRADGSEEREKGHSQHVEHRNHGADDEAAGDAGS